MSAITTAPVWEPVTDDQPKPPSRRWFRCRYCRVMHVGPTIGLASTREERDACEQHERTCPAGTFRRKIEKAGHYARLVYLFLCSVLDAAMIPIGFAVVIIAALHWFGVLDVTFAMKINEEFRRG